MKQRRLGESGLLVSVVGLGCNNFGGRLERDDSIRVVHAALDNGITLFDTADIYGGGRSEDFLGAALRDRRDRAIVATKFGMEMGGDALYRRGGSRIYVRQAVEASLRHLQTDHIDLYQMHEPDPSTPIWETLSVLDDLVHEGKVRYIGSSNFSGWQISDAEWTARSHGWTRFTAAQNQYSLLVRGVEREVIPACGHHGIGMLPFFPLAAGMLTGKYRRGEAAPEGTRLARAPSAQRYLTPRNFDVVEALQRFAGERGVGLLSVAIGGLAAQPCVASVIAGAMTPEQVAANVAAGEWEPGAEERAEIDRITKVPVPG
ncbi:MAG TPA: aldo/keto reductase [Candidatus Dormibacteraeota bacterium]|nr:aldo/keto reductase [Candidatus Dormibacteraeota bacterium]